MKPQDLPEADKHLLYGLLLKKKRNRVQERKVLTVVRSTMELGAKIEAIIKITRTQILRDPREVEGDLQATGRARQDERPSEKGMPNALVVDAHSEVARLLKKCALKREIVFFRIAERYDAVHLLAALRAHLIIVNETLQTAEEYSRYFEICRMVEPSVRIIFLGCPEFQIDVGSAFTKNARFISKPLNIQKLEEVARDLLSDVEKIRDRALTGR